MNPKETYAKVKCADGYTYYMAEALLDTVLGHLAEQDGEGAEGKKAYECDIRIFHIRPKPYCTGEVFPHALVFPDALLTFVNERLQTIAFNLLFAVKPAQEVAQGYKDVKERSAIVRFKAKGEDAYLLAWTTTPWTLPSNLGLCVNPKETYAKVKCGVTSPAVWVAVLKIRRCKEKPPLLQIF